MAASKSSAETERVDPGIEKVVHALRRLGYKIISALDGKRDLVSGKQTSRPNVTISVEAKNFIDTADNIHRLTKSYGEHISVQSMYFPGDRVGLVLLEGLDDVLFDEINEKRRAERRDTP